MDISKNVKDIFEKANAIREQAKVEIVAKNTAIKEPVKIPATEMPAQTNSPTVYVGLSGIQIKEDGTITKDGYLKKLQVDNELYQNMHFTEEEIKQVSYAMKRQSSGINSAVPLKCTGDLCAFRNSCPYMAIGKPPLAKPCLVESQLIHFWTEQYLEEFNVDAHNITEVHMVSELAEFNIYEMRVTKYLAENHPTLMQEFFVGIDATGQAISNLDIARAFELKEKIKKSRMKVLDALMATRKEKMKVISTISSNDSVSRLSDLKSKIMDLSRQVGTMSAVDGQYTEVK